MSLLGETRVYGARYISAGAAQETRVQCNLSKRKHPAEIAGKRQDGTPRKFHRRRDGGVPDVLSRQTLLASLKTKHCIDLTVSPPPSTGALQVRPRGRSMRRRRRVTLDSTVVLQESALFFSRLPHISFVPPWGPLSRSLTLAISPVRFR